MRIAIIGTRGIPNYYGGFEQCAEYLALGLKAKGYDVLVYNSHNHPYKESEWKGVRIKHCYDPEYKYGTVGQFIYDYNCIRDLRNEKCDIVLQLGYTSSSIWYSFLPKNSVVTTNMDGLEWKRTKYSKPVQLFLKYAEKLAVLHSDHLISDSIGIQEYLQNKYNKASAYIPYGSHVFNNPIAEGISEYQVEPFKYDLLIARLEPENSIEVILKGKSQSSIDRPLLIIGNHQTKYGEYLKNKFNSFKSIRFLGGIYDMNKLNNLRYYSHLYFHGHTVGGTNPSLLEAMASNCLICANDNPFNRFILEENGLYFKTSDDVARSLETADKLAFSSQEILSNNTQKIIEVYSWEKIVNQYVQHFNEIKGKINRK